MVKKYIKWKKEMPRIAQLIEDEYTQGGTALTVRRVYYLLYSQGIIPENTDSRYTKLSEVLANARLDGNIPWEHIQDRSRSITHPPIYDPRWLKLPDPRACMRNPVPEQDHYVEVWVEKDGIVELLEPVCRKFFVTLVCSGGRSSVTFKHALAERIRRYPDKRTIVLYLSDYDAHGEHFPIELKECLNEKEGVDVLVRKILLSWSQVQRYNLPHSYRTYKPSTLNQEYVREFVSRPHGAVQVELDAIPFPTIKSILDMRLSQVIDTDLNDRIKAQSVRKAKKRLNELVKNYVFQ